MNPQKSYGEWLSTYDWRWFTTLTFRNAPPKPHSALKKYKRWEERNALFLPGRSYSFSATEDGSLMGRLHIHSLVGGEGMGNKSEAWKDWFHDPFGGRAQILEYDKSMGASFYLSKYVSKSLGEWAIGGDWPTEEVSK